MIVYSGLMVVYGWSGGGPAVARGWLDDGPEWFGGDSTVAQVCLEK